MTEIDVEAQRLQVENAARRLYDLDQRVERGEVTQKNLRELGEAYRTYINVRSRNARAKKRGFLMRIGLKAE
jgi:hypothetical protein